MNGDESGMVEGFGAGEPEVQVHSGLQLMDQGALSAVERASIDVQITTAKAYPRSVTGALREAESLACLDEVTAAGMFYTLKRAGKNIMGPSTRLAEVVAGAWGNLRVDAGVESADRTHITAVATCFDLEKNVAIRVRVQRRITNSSGQRYNDDMIGTTGNAATSIALRNAVFRVVPRVFVDRLDLLARQASTGKGTLQEKRSNALAHFQKLGVTEAEVLAFVGCRGWDDVGLDEIVQLSGAKSSIKDGEATVEELFRPKAESQAAQGLGADLKASAATGAAAKPAAPAQPEQPSKPAAATKALPGAGQTGPTDGAPGAETGRGRTET